MTLAERLAEHVARLHQIDAQDLIAEAPDGV